MFEHGVVVRMRRKLRRDFDPPTLFEVGAIEPPQAELTVAGALQKQRANMGLLGIAADDANTVMKIGFGLRDRLPVD